MVYLFWLQCRYQKLPDVHCNVLLSCKRFFPLLELVCAPDIVESLLLEKNEKKNEVNEAKVQKCNIKRMQFD